MKTYKLLINRYSIISNDYIIEERIVKTLDIYHTIGYIYCTSLVHIKRIDYYEVIDDEKENIDV